MWLKIQQMALNPLNTTGTTQNSHVPNVYTKKVNIYEKAVDVEFKIQHYFSHFMA